MERLTETRIDPRDTCFTERWETHYTVKKEKKFKAFDKLGKLENLEEQVGCPLEIKCRICTDSFVYLPDGKPYLIVGVRDSYFRIRVEDGWTETVANSEYGISWWFKPDRSE